MIAMNRWKFLTGLGTLVLLGMPSSVQADLVMSSYQVDLATGNIPAIVGNYSFYFEVLSGTGDYGNSTAKVDQFGLGGGALSGPPTFGGSASGDPLAGLTLTDSDPGGNSVLQYFTPGQSLTFTVTLTTIYSPAEDPSLGGTPDQFSFGIYSDSGDISTTAGDGSSFLQVLFVGNNGESPASIFQTVDVSPFSVGPPRVESVPLTAVPEPSTFSMAATATGLLLYRAWRRRRAS